MKIRRSAKRELRTALGEFDEIEAMAAESRMRDRAKSLKGESFEKTRDLPLGIVIERQQQRRVLKGISAALKKSSIPEGGPVRVSVGWVDVFVSKRDAEKAAEIVSDLLKRLKPVASGNEDLERRFWLYEL